MVFFPFSILSVLSRFFWQSGPPEEKVRSVVIAPDGSSFRDLSYTYLWPMWAPISTLRNCPICSIILIWIVASWLAGARWQRLWNRFYLPRPDRAFKEPWRLWTFLVVPTYAANPSWPPPELSASVSFFKNDMDHDASGSDGANLLPRFLKGREGKKVRIPDEFFSSGPPPEETGARNDLFDERFSANASGSSFGLAESADGIQQENDGQGGRARLAAMLFDLWFVLNRLDAEGSPFVDSLFGRHSASYIDFSLSTWQLLRVLAISLPISALAVSLLFLPSTSKSWFPVSFGCGFSALFGVLDAVAYCSCRRLLSPDGGTFAAISYWASSLSDLPPHLPTWWIGAQRRWFLQQRQRAILSGLWVQFTWRFTFFGNLPRFMVEYGTAFLAAYCYLTYL